MDNEFTIYAEEAYECFVVGSDTDLDGSNKVVVGFDLQIIPGDGVMERIELASEMDVKDDMLHLVMKTISEGFIKRADMYICLQGMK